MAGGRGSPIAIVGIGGVFPGARDLPSFWANVANGVDASREPPPGRWVLPVDEAFDAEKGRPDKVYSRRACFVEDFELDLTGLDIDRDYTTWYELTIDSRGWTGDRVLGSAHWNPQWFVAADGDKTCWSVEAAIPWNQLAPEAPKSRDVWAVAACRVIPNVGLECWTGPPFERPGPEDFGLLIFE